MITCGINRGVTTTRIQHREYRERQRLTVLQRKEMFETNPILTHDNRADLKLLPKNVLPIRRLYQLN